MESTHRKGRPQGHVRVAGTTRGRVARALGVFALVVLAAPACRQRRTPGGESPLAVPAPVPVTPLAVDVMALPMPVALPAPLPLPMPTAAFDAAAAPVAASDASVAPVASADGGVRPTTAAGTPDAAAPTARTATDAGRRATARTDSGLPTVRVDERSNTPVRINVPGLGGITFQR